MSEELMKSYSFDKGMTVEVSGHQFGPIVITIDDGRLKLQATFEKGSAIDALAYPILNTWDGVQPPSKEEMDRAKEVLTAAIEEVGPPPKSNCPKQVYRTVVGSGPSGANQLQQRSSGALPPR
jgi:hypothetical protein